MGLGDILGGVGGLIGGAFAGEGEPSAEEKAYQQYLDELEELRQKMPTLESQLLDLPEYQIQDVGPLYLEDAPDRLEHIEVALDPELRARQEAQTIALEKLAQTGMAPEDVAALLSAEASARKVGRAQRDAAEQRLQRRGLGSSGAMLAAQMGAAQAASEAAGERGLDVIQQAGARRQQAQRDALAALSGLQSQSTGLAERQAAQRMNVNKFNIGTAADVARRNVEARRAQEALRLRERQRAEGSRVATGAEEARRRADLPGIQFGREADLLGSKVAGDVQKAKAEQERKAKAKESGEGIGSAIGGALGTGLGLL
jgi:hypothetical protein